MSNSYRIRTEVGVDKSIQLQLEQDFDFLEILSLKILPEQIYTRSCADYGVVVGRVSVNDGFGIPNAKVSVFVPLQPEDYDNPYITSVYPYRTANDINEDGYTYNLLPYRASYTGHIPTGTFPDRSDALIDPTVVEIYDKYYKYTVQTNDSGDFMIFGVPVGPQTLVLNVDLSDIGQFSLSPQDLIRMGRGSAGQFDGSQFKASPNFADLPQVVVMQKDIEVQPLWGQEDQCVLGINRSDFDLGQQGIKIEPTSVFMGSIFSDNDLNAFKRNCRPPINSGDLCNLIASAGQILAVRQTIYSDSLGRPLLEEHKLENGGKVIDGNGTWMIDLPMNLDYVYTNEFGENILSSDPKKGIPTKGKYRFKVKWDQPNTLSTPVRRADFLVPNIKEWGWDTGDSDNDPLTKGDYNSNPCAFDTTPLSSQPLDYKLARASYAFSTDWEDYGVTGTTEGDTMILEAINCEDRFYEFQFSKVYTISQLFTEYRKGVRGKRIIALKNTDNKDCQATTNKFPTNDAQYDPDLVQYIIDFFLLYVPGFISIFLVLLLVIHLVYFLLNIMIQVVGLLKIVVCTIREAEFLKIKPFYKSLEKPCNSLTDIYNKLKSALDAKRPKLPVLEYPSCTACQCQSDLDTGEGPQPGSSVSSLAQTTLQENDNGSFLSKFVVASSFNCSTTNTTDVAQMLAGYPIGDDKNNTDRYARTAAYTLLDNNNLLFSSSITIPERLNLFNTKGKYFDSFVAPGGGVNRIKVTFNSDEPLNAGQFHYDNVLILLVDQGDKDNFDQGNLFTFQSLQSSKDPNLTGLTTANEYGTYSITGSSVGSPVPGTNVVQSFVTVDFARPDGVGNTTTSTVPSSPTYLITGYSDDVQYAKFPIDLEYFQVIQSIDLPTFQANVSNSNLDSFPQRFLFNTNDVYEIDNATNQYTKTNYNGTSCFDNLSNQQVVICVRGVDPNSTRTKIKYDLSLIYGYSSFGNTSTIIEGDFKLNIPIQGDMKCVDHNQITTSTLSDSYSNGYTFYDSYHFQPGNDFSQFTTNVLSYYSNVDSAVLTSSLPPISSPYSVYSNSIYGDLRISQNNGYAIDFSLNGTSSTQFLGNYNDLVSNTKGYYPNEPVEGGSFMSMQITTNSGPTVGNNFQISAVLSDYFGTRYSLINTLVVLGTSGRQIVMRSDRLPTSTSVQTMTAKNSGGNIVRKNQFSLFQNNSLVVSLFNDDGEITLSLNLNEGSTNSINADLADEGSAFNTGILSTFQCANMVPISCYDVDSNGNMVVNTSSGCDQYLGQDIMQGGCYVLVSTVFLSYVKDIALIIEWSSRFKINLALCRGVFQNMFTNSWVNGSLYMFPFKNDRFFTPVTTTPIQFANKPYSCYCKHTIYQEPTTQAFYYRVSPWDGNYFIGRKNPRGGLLGGVNYNGNQKDLMFPTTILDMGPRTQYQQELVFNDSYDGYVMNRLNSTTYQDPGDILNLFVISRIGNRGFIRQILQGINVGAYFSRPNNKVDGDYAQMVSINSEAGVVGFNEENYLSPTSTFTTKASVPPRHAVFGIFFNSDTQTRDWISPKRTIVDEDTNFLNKCAFSNIPTKSQYVPFYQWEMEDNPDQPNIFGSQQNDWRTERNDAGSNGFFAYDYQSLDRLQLNSRYFRSKNTTATKYQKGYIYAVDGSGNVTTDVNYMELNQAPNQKAFTVGNPFYFYFGISNGGSAFDRFLTTWVQTDNLED